MGATELVPLSMLANEFSQYNQKMENLQKSFYMDGIPLGYQEINSVFGRCLFLSADPYVATIEQKYGGEKPKTQIYIIS